MSLTSHSLVDIGMGAGVTPHFHVQYDVGLGNQSQVAATANALLGVLETEFAVTTGWFGTSADKFDADHRQVVNLDRASGPNLGGGGNSGYGSPISLDSQNNEPDMAVAAERVKMLFINEWAEILMSLSGGKWNRIDSGGEGLSQFCGLMRFPDGHASYYGGDFVSRWLNTHTVALGPVKVREDWVSKVEASDSNEVSFGCALAFLFYLSRQRNFAIPQIINAGASTLADAYHNLTGASNGWSESIQVVDGHYPTSQTYTTPHESIFPVPELTAFVAPAEMTAGDTATAQVIIDQLAPAEIFIQMASNFSDVTAQPLVTIHPDAASAGVSLQAQNVAFAFPEKLVTLEARYAGRTLTAQLRLKSRITAGILRSVTVLPTIVTGGEVAHGAVTLEEAVPVDTNVGLVAVDPESGPLPIHPSAFASVQESVHIAAGNTTGRFSISTSPASRGTSHAVTILASAVATKSARLTVTG